VVLRSTKHRLIAGSRERLAWCLDELIVEIEQMQAESAHLEMLRGKEIVKLRAVADAFRHYHTDPEQKVTNYLAVVRALENLDRDG